MIIVEGTLPAFIIYLIALVEESESLNYKIVILKFNRPNHEKASSPDCNLHYYHHFTEWTGTSAKPARLYAKQWFPFLQTDTPYAETYLSVPGNSIVYKTGANGKYEGALEVTLLYLKDSNTVAAFDKYILRSPEIDDTSNITFNMLDIRRVSLPDGVYNVQMQVLDINSTDKEPLTLSQGLNMHFHRDSIDFSNIELIDSYTPTTTKNVFLKTAMISNHMYSTTTLLPSIRFHFIMRFII